MNGGMKLVKYGLFLINLIFVIAGIALLYVGISTNSRINTFEELVNLSSYSIPSKLFIGVGIVMFVVAFLGCCGSVKENHFMVMTYSVLVGLILVLQIGAAIAAYTKSDELNEIMGKGLKESMKDYHTNNETRKFWDFAQTDVKCCGALGFRDWFDIPVVGGYQVPDSCCITNIEGCAKDISPGTPNATAAERIFTQGCVEKGVEYMDIGRGATVGIVLAVVELLAVVFACLLAKSIRYSYETV